jgi:hypothetical protein
LKPAGAISRAWRRAGRRKDAGTTRQVIGAGDALQPMDHAPLMVRPAWVAGEFVLT